MINHSDVALLNSGNSTAFLKRDKAGNFKSGTLTDYRK